MIRGRVWLWVLLFGVPLRAQPDSARIRVLEEKIALLDSIIGTRTYLEPRWPCAEKEQHRPTVNFPNGEYSLEYRNRQFGCFVSIELQAQISGLASRLATVEAATGQNTGVLTVDRLCIGQACDPGAPMLLQIHGQGDADLLMCANLSHTNPQQGTNEPCHVFGAQSDGGTRWEFNWFCRTDRPCANGGGWVNTALPRRIVGFDSQGTFSFSDDAYPNIDNSQTFVLRLDRGLLEANWQLMKAGWHWALGTSSCTNCFDKKFTVPQQ